MKQRIIIKINLVLIIFLLVVAQSTGVFAKTRNVNPSKELNSSGIIQGTVYCEGDGVEGIIVYIPGESYNVILGSSGEFKISFVPVGTYDLNFLFKHNPILTINNVKVIKRSITDLGIIPLCPWTPGEACYTYAPETRNVGQCQDGTYDDQGNCIGEIGPETEYCSPYDEDCDGEIDEDSVCPCSPGESIVEWCGDPVNQEVNICEGYSIETWTYCCGDAENECWGICYHGRCVGWRTD